MSVEPYSEDLRRVGEPGRRAGAQLSHEQPGDDRAHKTAQTIDRL